MALAIFNRDKFDIIGILIYEFMMLQSQRCAWSDVGRCTQNVILMYFTIT